MIDRRGFLGALGAFAAGAVLDPERLLWVPGRKTIFVPAKPIVQRLVFHRDAYALVMADLIGEAAQHLADEIDRIGLERMRSYEINRLIGLPVRPDFGCLVLG